MPADQRPPSLPSPRHRAALGELALAAAKVGNHTALAGAVADGSVDPDGVLDADGNTLLLLAAAGGHAESVMLLLDAGADIGATNRRGEGVLHACFANGHTSLGTAVAARQHDAAGGLESDWAACAEEHGVDTQAILAAMDLGLDLRLFEAPKARAHEDRAGESRLSSSARFLEDLSESILSADLYTGTDETPPAGSAGSRRRPPNVTRLQLPGHGAPSDGASSSAGSQRPAPPVPGLQLPVRGESDAGMSSGERELTQAALEARHAEAELYMAADLGQSTVHDAKRDRAKREKMRHKRRGQLEPASQARAHKGAHVTEAIVLMGQAQAAFESEQARLTRAQQGAAGLDREIQEQLDQGLLAEAEAGDSNAIRSWLDKGASVDALQPHTNSTALHLAAAAGHKKACKALLREGAHLDARNAHGHTPAQAALGGGHQELAQYLDSKAHCVHEDYAVDLEASRDGAQLVCAHVPVPAVGHVVVCMHACVWVCGWVGVCVWV